MKSELGSIEGRHCIEGCGWIGDRLWALFEKIHVDQDGVGWKGVLGFLAAIWEGYSRTMMRKVCAHQLHELLHQSKLYAVCEWFCVSVTVNNLSFNAKLVISFTWRGPVLSGISSLGRWHKRGGKRATHHDAHQNITINRFTNKHTRLHCWTVVVMWENSELLRQMQ